MKKNYAELLESIAKALKEAELTDDKTLCQKLINYAIDNENNEHVDEEIEEMIKIRRSGNLINEATKALISAFGCTKARDMIEAIEERGLANKF